MRTKAIIGIVAVFILAAAGWGGWYYLQQKGKANPAPSMSEEQVRIPPDWKPYMHSDQGWTIYVPPQWKVEEEIDTYAVTSIGSADGDGKMTIELFIPRWFQGISLGQFLESPDAHLFKTALSGTGKYLVDRFLGNEAYVWESKPEDTLEDNFALPEKGSPGYFYRGIAFEANAIYFFITLEASPDSEYRGVLDLMLDSFQSGSADPNIISDQYSDPGDNIVEEDLDNRLRGNIKNCPNEIP